MPQLLLVEGWMLGYKPFGEDQLSFFKKHPGMDQVNDYLKDYSSWENHFDARIIVEVEDTNVVFQWREQQEKALRAAGKGAMTEEEVKAFCERFMPSYEFESSDKSERELNFSLNPLRNPYVTEKIES